MRHWTGYFRLGLVSIRHLFGIRIPQHAVGFSSLSIHSSGAGPVVHNPGTVHSAGGRLFDFLAIIICLFVWIGSFAIWKCIPLCFCFSRIIFLCYVTFLGGLEGGRGYEV